MSKNTRLNAASVVLLMAAICLVCVGGTHTPWDGTAWDITSPDIDQLIGNHYKEMFDLRKGVAIRMNKEHETLATASAGGVHKQGSARAFFQDTAPATQINGDAFDSGDLGSFWFDTNATPDNLFYVLTATTPTWTLISTSLSGEALTWTANSIWDDGTTDSPSLTLQDATNETFVLVKKDSGNTQATIPADTDFQIVTGNLAVGDGSPGTAAMDGEDLYVEGELEVDGAVQFDGTLTVTTIADGAVATTQTTEDNSTKLATTAYVDRERIWGAFAGSGGNTILDDFGVASVAAGATGVYVITWTTAFATANYAVMPSIRAGSAESHHATVAAQDTTTCTINVYAGGVLSDAFGFSVIAMGNQ